MTSHENRIAKLEEKRSVPVPVPVPVEVVDLVQDFSPQQLQIIVNLCNGAWAEGVKDENVGKLLSGIKDLAVRRFNTAQENAKRN